MHVQTYRVYRLAASNKARGRTYVLYVQNEEPCIDHFKWPIHISAIQHLIWVAHNSNKHRDEVRLSEKKIHTHKPTGTFENKSETNRNANYPRSFRFRWVRRTSNRVSMMMMIMVTTSGITEQKTINLDRHYDQATNDQRFVSYLKTSSI